MALMIIETCTACDAREPVCPQQGHFGGQPDLRDRPDEMHRRVGAEDEPQRKLACPAHRHRAQSRLVESEDDLLGKYAAAARVSRP